MSAASRENCHSLHLPILQHVLAHRGRRALEEVLRLAGETRPVEVVLDTAQWCSWDQTRRLLDAARDVLGSDDEVRAAAAHFDPATVPEASAETLAALHSLGGPAGILTAVSQAASKFSSCVAMEALDVDDDGGTVAARSVAGRPRYRMLCEATAGMLRTAATIFGLDASVEEERCEVRGDPECRFRVQWRGRHDTAVERDAERSRATAGLRALRSTVAELVSGHDVATVLQRVVEHAGRAVRAPRHLIAVRLRDEAEARVHAVGFDAGAAGALAEGLLVGTHQVSDAELVAEVRSGDRRYGWLVAANPSGAGFLPDDPGNLRTYAELAAVALDSATAIVEARRHAETAEALLELAGAVAEVSSVGDVAERLVATVPRVVGATSSAMMVWNGHDLVTVASFGLPSWLAAELEGYRAPLEPDGPLRRAVARGEPYVLATSEAAGRLRHILEESGISAVAVVPIRCDDELFGVVTAGVTVDVEVLRDDAHLLRRLRGLASFAATALRNAALLETVRHQSLHDPLTGVPNGRLLEDRAERALAAARRSGHGVGVLFVDLDGFKAVNDAHGHLVGDEVLRAVAARLRGAVREVDTVARLGGDEFVVLLPDVATPDDVHAVVGGLRAEVREPIEVAGRRFCLDASVGIAIGPRDGADFGALLRVADADMYATKRDRGAMPRQATPPA